MTQHLIDTPPKLGRCARCGSWVFTALVSGAWAGVDTAPLSAVELRAVVLDGRRAYRLRMAAGHAQALTRATPRDVAAGTPLLGEHACSGHPMDAQGVLAAPAPPLCPPVSATGPQGRPSVSEARRGTTQPLATRAIPHRSRRMRCSTCRQVINPRHAHWAIECGTYIWAVHDACPEVEG